MGGGEGGRGTRFRGAGSGRGMGRNGGGRGGGGGPQAEKIACLERENAVASGHNTPSGQLSIANMMRRRFRAMCNLGYGKGVEGEKKEGRKRGG